MIISSTRTVTVLALVLSSALAFSQNPDCPTPTFFKTLGLENKSEFATVIAESNDGNLYLSGRNGNKTFIQKTDLSGAPIWMREFQISQFEPITPSQIFEDSEGMIVGCGTQSQFAGARRGFVFRYDPVADMFLWAHPIASNNPLSAGILEKNPGDSYVYYQNPILASGERDIEVLDLDRATGNVIPAFASRYEHISTDQISKMISVDGSLFAIGHAGIDSSNNLDNSRMLLTRFDPVNGMPIWAKLYPQDSATNGDFYGRDIVADSNALVSAYIGTGSGLNGSYRLFAQKTDLDGNILWVRRYDIFSSVSKLLNVSDGYVIYGRRYESEHIVLKINKDGIPVWNKRLTVGPLGDIDPGVTAPNLGISVADSLYFTGTATTGLSDVAFWKMYSDGTMADSCGLLDSLIIASQLVENPVTTPINLQQLISTAVFTNSTNIVWTPNTLEEHLLCPDCTVPNPCPAGNDFVVNISQVSCAAGFIHMEVNICELAGGPLPDLSISFYNSNPLTTGADKLATYDFVASNQDSCASFQINNLANQFGAGSVQNGDQIFALVNDLGFGNTPIQPGDFPLSDLEECNYDNNLDSITVQLPVAPTLNLGADQIICANEQSNLNAGPGFFKYQWSNGATTQTTSVNFGGNYRITVTDACGFQQFDTISVQVRQLPVVLENAAFCPGKSVTVRGFTFDQTGNFQKIIPGQGTDCDTTATFFISELPYEERVEQIFFCPFTTVTINGVTYEDSGLVRDTVPSSTTCDTIVFYFLNQLPLPFRNYQFEICPGESVTFNGNVYNTPTSFTDTLYSSGFGCDTVAYVNIIPGLSPVLLDTIRFCPGTSVDLNGQQYTQPGTVSLNIPALNGGCDTVATYVLEWLSAPQIDKSIQFCPGGSVTIDGQSYSQPGTVLSTISGGGGSCDTLVTYTLSFSPAPTKAITLEFCQGESITVAGQTYTQPTTFTLNVPGAVGTCDTLVTYTLQYLNPGPSALNLVCPATINVATVPGSGPIAVSYAAPVATSNCECPGTSVNLSSGGASGSLFPVGNTQVCYAAEDNCGSVANCCFTVTVREELPCDTKTNGCMKYELLSITANSKQERTYTIRVTNNCSNKLIYTAIQLPDGYTAVSPSNLSTYTSPEGRNYAVRNPNYSPFYSIRFKSTNDSIVNGQSEVFQYTLPAQASPTYINITSRLETQVFYPAHLNTFNCPIGVTPTQNRGAETTLTELVQDGILLYPNPSSGVLFADLSRWDAQDLSIQVLDSRAVRTQAFSLTASAEAQAIPLSSDLPSGLYFLEIVTGNGERVVTRFVLER